MRALLRALTLSLLALSSITGCLGGPTLRPAATDLERVVHSFTPLASQPLLYVAIEQDGNLETLYGITIGNRKAVPIMSLNTSTLQAGEIAPIGIDPNGFLITAGIQSEPRATIQVLDLKSGKAKKMIGPDVTERSTKVTHYAPPQWFLGTTFEPETPAYLVGRLYGGADQAAMRDELEQNPWFGLESDGRALGFLDASQELVLWDLYDNQTESLVSVGSRCTSALISWTSGSQPRVFYTAGTDALPESQLWVQPPGGTPQPLTSNLGDNRQFGDLVPPGWPPFTTLDHWVLAAPARSAATVDPEGAIYLIEEDGLRKVHSGKATVAWLIAPNHLLWITDNRLFYRVLDDPEGTETELLALEPLRKWYFYPATWPGLTPLAPES